MKNLIKTNYFRFVDINSRKSVKDITKFNKIPKYNLEKSVNLTLNEELNENEAQHKLFQLYNKDTKKTELNKVLTAKYILEAQNQRLIKDGYKSAINDQINFNKTSNKTQVNSYNTSNEETLDYKYGDYSKYFSIKKNKLEISNQKTSESLDKTKNISPLKKIEKIKEKYSTNTNVKENVKFNEKLLSDKLFKNLNEYSKDDQDLIKFLSKTTRENNDEDKWIYLMDKINSEHKINKTFKEFFQKNQVGNLLVQSYIKAEKPFLKKQEEPEPDLIDDEFSEHGESNNTQSYLNLAINIECDSLNTEFKKQKETLSLDAQDELYNLYLDGTDISTLCIKFGILGKTVKNIICQRYIYNNFIYPRIGPIKHRENVEEAKVSKKYRFVDYGLELNQIIKENRTIIPENLSFKPDSDYDYYKSFKFLNTIKRKRKKYTIPIKYIGDRYKGMLIREIFNFEGAEEGERSVVKEFKKYCNNISNNYSYCKKATILKKHLGPRFASFKK